MSRPQRPGDPVEITVTLPGKLVRAIQDQEHARPEGWETAAVYDLVRAALPPTPRPVAGEMPADLAAWLESTELTGADVRTYRPLAGRFHRFDLLLEWAKALVLANVVETDGAVAAEIVEGHQLTCDEVETSLDDHIWICTREAGHATPATGTGGHYDPERGWW